MAIGGRGACELGLLTEVDWTADLGSEITITYYVLQLNALITDNEIKVSKFEFISNDA